MGKVFNFTFVALGMMVLLGAAGLSTAGGYILATIGLSSPTTLSQFQTTPFWLWFDRIFLIVATLSAVTIGIYGRQSALDGITAGLVTAVMMLFIGDFIMIVNIANLQSAWAGWVIFLILSPFIVMYVFSLWEWIRGRD